MSNVKRKIVSFKINTFKKSLWNDNPLVQGSTNPKDFKIVKNGRSRV